MAWPFITTASKYGAPECSFHLVCACMGHTALADGNETSNAMEMEKEIAAALAKNHRSACTAMALTTTTWWTCERTHTRRFTTISIWADGWCSQVRLTGFLSIHLTQWLVEPLEALRKTCSSQTKRDYTRRIRISIATYSPATYQWSPDIPRHIDTFTWTLSEEPNWHRHRYSTFFIFFIRIWGTKKNTQL